MTVTNSTFDPGVFDDVELTGTMSDFDQVAFKPGAIGLRKWYTSTASNEFGLFPGNRSFSMDFNDDKSINGYLEGIFITARDGPFYLPVASNARSMTYAIGQSLSGTTLEGKTITSEQYIRVDWPRIALHLAEVVMSIAFMVCTLTHTQRKGVTP
jgi:hypothetical protein